MKTYKRKCLTIIGLIAVSTAALALIGHHETRGTTRDHPTSNSAEGLLSLGAEHVFGNPHVSADRTGVQRIVCNKIKIERDCTAVCVSPKGFKLTDGRYTNPRGESLVIKNRKLEGCIPGSRSSNRVIFGGFSQSVSNLEDNS